MNFSFSKALSSIVDVGTKFLTGTGSKDDYGIGEFGEFSSKDNSSGFLGLVARGAKAYREMQDDKDGNVFQQQKPFKQPEIDRYRGRAAPGGLTGPATRWTPRNQIVNDALLRRLKNANFEATLEKMTASTTVRPTARRKAPVTPEKSEIRRTTAAPRISTQ